MSPEMEAIVAEHNVEALDNLLTYVSSYIRKHDDSLPPNNVLPMSELKYPLQHPADGLGFDWGTPVGGALIHFRNKVLIASPFVALSGAHCSAKRRAYLCAMVQEVFCWANAAASVGTLKDLPLSATFYSERQC